MSLNRGDKLIGVIDYHVGNNVAINNLLRKIGVNFKTISKLDDFEGVDTRDLKLILPGVGSFDSGMRSLIQSGLDKKIRELARTEVKILGICLGMQLLFEGSEEGDCRGLALINGSLVRIKAVDNCRVPHVGWQHVKKTREDPLLEGVEKIYFYHNHSYALSSPHENEFASIEYGNSYTVGVRKANAWGVQFHPEKSHGSGEKLLRNFISIS